jgi:hypothetical protein
MQNKMLIASTKFPKANKVIKTLLAFITCLSACPFKKSMKCVS